jgi:hypothetical protein
MSLNSLNNFIKEDRSCSEHPVPKLIFKGFSLVPKFIVSKVKEELFILQLTDPLNLSCKSKNLFSLTTDLGIEFTRSDVNSGDLGSDITVKLRRISS